MPDKGEKSIGQLVSELTQDFRTLFRQELELFSAEMKEKLTTVAKDSVGIGVGGILIYSGFLVLLAAIVLGLATVMPAWGAALVAAALFMGIGAVLVLKAGKELTHLEKKPEQTTEALKETVQWAKTLRPRNSTPRPTPFATKSDIPKAI